MLALQPELLCLCPVLLKHRSVPPPALAAASSNRGHCCNWREQGNLILAVLHSRALSFMAQKLGQLE